VTPDDPEVEKAEEAKAREGWEDENTRKKLRPQGNLQRSKQDHMTRWGC